MPPSSRRTFLKQAGAAAFVAAAQREASPLLFAAATPGAIIPPHRKLELPGLHAYPSPQSVAAGGTIRFHVSSTAPYQVSIYRLGPIVDDPASNELIHTFEPSGPTPQPIHPGSYVYIEKRLRRPLRALTLECWVRAWDLTRLQGLISQEDKADARGFALGLGKDGYVGFFVGDGVAPDEAVVHRTGPEVLAQKKWHHVVARWDGKLKEVWVDGKLAGQWPFVGQCVPGPHALRLGAMSEHGVSRSFLDGDLAMPVIYGRALSAGEIAQRFQEQGAALPPRKAVLACWPLREERGERVADASGQGRHGRIINHATWMIGGPAFDGSKVPRFGPYDPAMDQSRGHGLRLASDDLYDCRWRATHEWRVPVATRPGLYIASLRYELDGAVHDYPVTFIVRKARSRPRAPLVVLCASNTWQAYNSAPFSLTVPPGTNFGTNGYKNSHPEAPAFSCYRNHRAGQPSYQFGLRMPWPSAGPYLLYGSRETGYSHLMRSERFFHAWLEQAGYACDVVSDLDLHRDPDLLRGYRALVINGHSEYWSKEAYEGVDRFLCQGGAAVVLSGNTMFWRTTFSADGTVMECRKYDDRIGGRGGASLGELFHSHDGKRGSLMRECGYAAWRVVGLECCGWGAVEAKDAGVYHLVAPDHFLFHQPEEVGLAAGETFGHSPDGNSHRAVGHEYDVRLSTLAKMTKHIPPGGLLPDEPAGITTLAVGRRPDKSTLDYFTHPTESPEGILAELIYWERPQGGRVFHAGAIGAGWALAVDTKFQALMRNVLHAFNVTPTRRRS